MSRMPEDMRIEFLASEAAAEAPLPAYDSRPDPALASLKEIDLRQHLTKFEGLGFNGKGTCLCPVHTETSPSFEVKRHTDGHWYWFDWHNQGRDGFSGTIIDYYVTIKGLDLGEAIRTIREREGIEETVLPPQAVASRSTGIPILQSLADRQIAEPDAAADTPFEGTLAQFLLTQIPPPISLVHDLVNENEFMLLGGVKGSHKTTAMMNMGLAFASGLEFLGFKPAREGRFLMIQQELSEGEFQKRLRAAAKYCHFNFDNFFPYTGTADPIRILDKDGWKRLVGLIEKFKPDWIGLDPLSKFHRVNESDPRVWAEIRDLIHYIKVTYGAVTVSQHFTSKRAKDDPTAPAEAAGMFRGHTVLSDSADVLFCLHRLPGQKNNPNLTLPYEDYNLVEIELRNGRWPARFAIELDGASYLISRSNVWHELGAKIELGNVRQTVEAHGGEMLFANLVEYYQKLFGDGVGATTVRNAVDKEVDVGYVTTERLTGRGKPILVRSREKAA